VLDAEEVSELWQAFSELSQPCRTLLRMLMADPPPSYAEISATLDMPIGSIGPQRARCLARLRSRVGDGPEAESPAVVSPAGAARR
jgi:DNA-directed RNA polymerase specialized sigma24 family protein